MKVIGMASYRANKAVRALIEYADTWEKFMSDSNVVDLWNREPKKKKEPEPTPFEDAIEQNRLKKEKLEKERLQQNKSVLRSYRIKH